jgi:hypothetical protein
MDREKTNNGNEAAVALGQLRGRFEQWREQNGPGRRRRIPVTLWEEAAGLAQQQGVFKVARTLGLDYATLKERSGVKTGQPGKQAAMPFVEVMMPGPMERSESVIELTNRKGARMTIRLYPHCGKDMVDLAEVFLRQPK